MLIRLIWRSREAVDLRTQMRDVRRMLQDMQLEHAGQAAADASLPPLHSDPFYRSLGAQLSALKTRFGVWRVISADRLFAV